MVGDRSDWCISRQRTWGMPIPVFYDNETGEPLINADTLAHIQALFAEKGSDAWWELSEAELLPEPYRIMAAPIARAPTPWMCGLTQGSSWAAVAKQRTGSEYPVDLYLEGSDQHRGWFQSSLLTSVAVNGLCPLQTGAHPRLCPG
jgi:isoleucyl-tRNA synthetase